MIKEKKIVVHDKEYNLLYTSYCNADNSRASLKILHGKIHIVSLHLVRSGFIIVAGNQKRKRCKSVLEAKVLILKYLTNS